MMNKNYNYKHPTTVWEPVKEDIEKEIISGKYAVGNCVPSIAQICEIYNVGSSTAKRVLKSLEDDGTVLNKRGIGYFVKPYVKEKLLVKHKRVLRERIQELASVAKDMGYNKDEFMKLFDEISL